MKEYDKQKLSIFLQVMLFSEDKKCFKRTPDAIMQKRSELGLNFNKK